MSIWDSLIISAFGLGIVFCCTNRLKLGDNPELKHLTFSSIKVKCRKPAERSLKQPHMLQRVN